MVETRNLSHGFVPQTTARVDSLFDLLELRAQQDSSAAAYTFLPDGEGVELSLTYRELDRQARAVAAKLMELARPGDRALLLYAPGLDFLPAFFGCVYSRITAVPAYPPHRNRNLLRLQAIIGDARPSLILTTSALLPKIAKAMAESPELAGIQLVATDEAASEDGRVYQRPAIDRDTIAFLQYTSGSTGNPKGVMLSHENLLHNAALVHYAVEHGPGDSYVSWLPVFHDMGFMAGVLQPLYGGLPCVQMAPAAFLQQPLRWLAAISKYRATTSGGPNFAYELCARKISAQERAQLDLSSWTAAFNGAEPVQAETMERFAAAFAPSGFRPTAMYPCYGLAEATLMVSGSFKQAPPVVGHFEKSALENHRVTAAGDFAISSRTLVGCGRVLPDQELAIVDPGSLATCAPGEVGEIWVKGPSVAKGYWNRRKESKETFHAYPVGTGNGPFLRTGDLGFVERGQLFVTGRLKDLLIIRGQNHYPQDIELTVERCDASLHAGCGAAFSIEVDGEERVVIVQEAASGANSNFDETIRLICQRVAEHHELTPYAVALIKTGTIPKTSSGKIQRRACKAGFLNQELHALKQWREAGQPEASEAPAVLADPGADRHGAAAAWLISEIARRVSIAPASVDVHQPITAYGLDSLTAIELAHRLQTGFGIDVQMSDLFDSLTIAQIVNRPAAGIAHVTEQPDNYPLSPGQRALWFLHQMAPDCAAYNISRAVRIRSELDVESLRRAFQDLAGRHACLRTTFAASSGEPEQQVQRDSRIDFHHIEAHAWSDAQLESELTGQGHNPFDLAQGPLFRVHVYTRSAGDHVLHIAVHHIVSDFWSLMLLLDEAGKLYDAHRRKTGAQLAPLACSYADFVAWQRQQLSGSEGERLWSYWKQQLSGELPPLNLATDHPRPPVQTFRGASHPFALSGELTGKLKQLGASQQATLFTTLLAAFQVLLHRITAQDQIVVGSPAAGRPRAEFADLIGYFVNPLPLRAEFRHEQTFNAFLAQARKTVLEAFAHDLYPFPLMVENLGIARDFSSSPVFQSMFVFQQAYGEHSQEFVRLAVGEAGASMKLGGLELEPIAYEERVAQFDVTLMLGEGAEGLTGAWQYNSDLFEAATVARWADSFGVLLEAIIANSETPVSQLPILVEQERRKLLDAFNQTDMEFDAEHCLHQQIEQQAKRTPDKTAVVCRGVEISYRELDGRANQVARYLRGRGVGREDLVGICTRRSVEMLTVMLGVWKAGAAYVPLDPQYPEQRLRFMLEDSAAKVVISEESLRSKVQGTGAAVLCLDREREQIARESREPIAQQVDSAQVAYVIYTSGSTGTPKGVMLAHRNAMSFVAWAKDTFSEEEFSGVLAATSICFDLSIFELWGTLSCGGTVVLAEDVLQWWESLREARSKGRVKLINTVPSAIAQLLQRGPLPDSVCTVNLAGEALKEPLVKQIYQSGTVRQVNNLYGPTETTTYSSWTKVAADQPVSIGRGVANTQLYVLDRELELAPVGVVGELYIGGAGLARGYWRHADWTADRFQPDPYSAIGGARMYRTGDLARWRADGELEYVGRADHQVKIRGYRIEPGEIEAALGQHAGVAENVVVVKDRGGDPRLVAYVAERAGQQLSEEQLREHLRQRMPGYMTPAQIVILKELPKTPNGKIDRKALPEPERGAVQGREPRNPIEQELAHIWAAVLKLDQVGVEEDFFALGGHSLLATQIVARVEERFQVQMPLRKLFESPTIAAMAHAVERALEEPNTSKRLPVRRTSRREPLSLSFAQDRVWFLEQLQPGTATYNIPVGIEMLGPVETPRVEQALTEILRRHESLRTVFPSSGGRPAQVIQSPKPFPLLFSDLSQVPGDQAGKQLEQIKSLEAEMPFDLETGPLVRARLVRLQSDEHFLLLTMHHIISDGPSIENFLWEFTELYSAFSRNEPSPLPDLAVQYADFVDWQRKWVRGALLDSELAYWREQLQDSSAMLELPTDRPRTAQSGLASGIHQFQLSRSMTDGLKELARGHGATLHMVMLAALKVLLSKLSWQDDINVGTPVSHRPGAETESLIGFFVNTLVLRDWIPHQAPFRIFLNQVRETTLDAYAHQNLPFERLVEELQPDRSLSHSPFFQVMFAFQQSLLKETECGGLKLRPFLMDNGTGKFDVTLMLGEGAEGLTGAWQYNSDLFEAATVARWADSFGVLLEAIIANPETLVSQLPILVEQERRQLLSAFNQTGLEFDAERCLDQQIEQQAKRTPDKTAVVCRGVEISYRELDGRANQVARYLRGRGVGREDLVGICTKRSVEMLTVMLGVWKAGAAYVPLDPQYPEQRLRFMLEDSAAKVVISEESLRSKVQGTGAAVLCLDREREQIARESREPIAQPVDSAQVAYVIYTSGSTGMPKGVMLAHRNAMSFVAWAKDTFSEEEFSGVLAATSICFDLSIFELWGTLSCGGTVVLAEDVLQWWESLRETRAKGRVKLINTVPSAIAQLLQRGPLPDSVRTVNLAGEALKEPLVKQIYQSGKIRQVNNLYGPTETTTYSSWTKVAADQPVSIGRGVANTQLYVLDRELELAPVGVVGELYIGGAGLARGYWRHADWTADRFQPDPYSAIGGARMYRTGDLARWRADGELEYVGRADHQVKIRGYRIEPGEIEAALGQHSGVAENVVVVKDRGGDPRLVAYVAERAGQQLSEEQLREHLRQRMPGYMTPAQIVILKELPKTPNGKIDRKALPEPERGAVPGREPRNPIEQELAHIWAAVLKLDQVGVEEDFFALGGHSLLATQIVARVEERFQVQMPLRKLFESPTIAAMALAVEMGEAQRTPRKMKRIARGHASLQQAVAEVSEVLK